MRRKGCLYTKVKLIVFKNSDKKLERRERIKIYTYIFLRLQRLFEKSRARKNLIYIGFLRKHELS